MSDKKVIVVSNSPVVLEKKLGEKIDKFDIIIRINDFEINGYEEHVGTKTHIWASYSAPKQHRSHPIYRIAQWMDYYHGKMEPFKEIWTVRESKDDSLFIDNIDQLSGFCNSDTEFRYMHKIKRDVLYYRKNVIRRGSKLQFVTPFIGKYCKLIEPDAVGTGFLTILNAVERFGNITLYGNSFFQDDVSKKAREENGKDYLGKHYYTADIERYKDTDRYEYFKRQIKREGMGLKGQKPLKEKAVIDYLILQGKIKVLT